MSEELPRVAFLSSRPKHGGSQAMLLQLAAAHAGRGGWAHVLAPGPFEILDRARDCGLDASEIGLHEGLIAYGGALTQLPAWRLAGRAMRALPPFALRLASWLRHNRVDVLYAAEGRAGLLASAAVMLARVPMLLHLQAGARGGEMRLVRFAVRVATRSFAVSQAVREDLHDQVPALSRARSSVVYNGLPDLPLLPRRAPDDRFALLFVGRLTPEKGVHHAIAAVARLPPSLRARTHLTVVGEDRDGLYLPWLRSLADVASLTDQVHFVGFREDVPEQVAACDVMLCPSVEDEWIPWAGGERHVQWKEGFCLAAAEAMRGARPVIASRSYGLAEVVDAPTTGLLVAPSNPDALAEALAVLAADPAARETMGHAGRARFLAHFTAERMADGFEAVVALTASRSPGRRRSA